MKLLKLTKRQNEHERCLVFWTPWMTVVFDFGSVQCRGTDEFELVIKHRAWGPVFYWGNRDIEKLGERNKFDSFQFTRIQPRYAELRKKRIDDRDFYEIREQLVREGKRKNPADMTYAERHAATMDAVKRMEFSNNFVHLMTTPAAKLALERGEIVTDDVTGEVLTEKIYDEHAEKSLKLPIRSGGILGFKKAKDRDGYEAICVPGMERRQMATNEDLKTLTEG
jgi:hypothetical protein